MLVIAVRRFKFCASQARLYAAMAPSLGMDELVEGNRSDQHSETVRPLHTLAVGPSVQLLSPLRERNTNLCFRPNCSGESTLGGRLGASGHHRSVQVPWLIADDVSP